MIETVNATECSYDGLVIDQEVLDVLMHLEMTFDMDMGDNFEAMYTNLRILHGVWGFECEVGEIKDALKKSLFYRKELDITNIFEEIGDCLYFVSLLEDELDTTFYGTREFLDKLARHYNGTLDVCQTMVETKLRVRYPEGFTTEAANKRNLKKERQTLEDGC